MKTTMQIELPLDHEPSLNYWAKCIADDDVVSGYWISWDAAYESAWQHIEWELSNEQS
jgi:hypothetical protein